MKRIISLSLALLMIMICTFPATAVTNEYNIFAEISKTQYIPGEQVLINGAVTKNSVGYGDTPVIIKIQNLETKIKEFVKEVYTDSEGKFNISYILPQDIEAGEYQVIIDSVGLSKTLNFTVIVAESTLELDKNTYYQGEEVNISGTAIKDGFNQPFVTVIIKVLYKNGPKFTKELLTDVDGKYETSYKLSKDQPLGTYTVQAEILGKTLEKTFTVNKEPAILDKIEIEVDKTEIKVGDKLQLSLTGKMSDGSEAPESELEGVEWSSSNEGVATVNQNGLVTGKGKGKATITARVGELEATMEITVTKETSPSPGGGGGSSSGSSEEDEEETETDQGKATVIKDEEGNISVSFEVDNNKLEDQIENEESDKVEINADVEEDAGEITVSMDAELISKVNEKGKKLTIKTGEAVIQIDPDSFDVEKGAKINLKVSKLNETITKELVSKVESNQYTTASNVLDLELTFDKDGEESKIQFKKPVTVTINYDKSKVKDKRKLGAYYYNEETEKWEYVGGKADAEGKITFTVDHFSKYAAMEYNKTFADIDIPWAKDAIEVLAARHVIDGVDEEHYAPNNNISRAAFAKLIVKALNLQPGDNVVVFTDVEEGQWYTEPINTAASLGIVTGYDGKFNPNGEITREAMATMIVRALKYVDQDGDYTLTITAFEDIDEVSDWAKEAVGIAYNKGIVNGVNETTFAPKTNATRAHAAVMIYRMLEVLDLI